MVKNSPANAREYPWRGKWQGTSVFLPGKSYGQRSLAGCSRWGHKDSDTTENSKEVQGDTFRHLCIWLLRERGISFRLKNLPISFNIWSCDQRSFLKNEKNTYTGHRLKSRQKYTFYRSNQFMQFFNQFPQLKKVEMGFKFSISVLIHFLRIKLPTWDNIVIEGPC